MVRTRLGVGAALLVILAQGARAQEPASQPDGVNVARLGVDVSRIRRQLQRAESRPTGEGLNLEFFVGVFAEAPPLQLFPQNEPNYFTLPSPYGAPTHNEMVRMMTPREFSSAPLIQIGVPRRKK